jgi:molybdate transport system substrate-binding protein
MKAFLVTAGLFTVVSMASAAEIQVMSSLAIKEAYLELVPGFESQTKHKVVTSWVGMVDILKRIKAGESTDLIIGSAAALEELIKAGKIVPASRTDLVKSGVGVAVRAGAPRPDISSGEAVKRALLKAKSIAYSSGPSGVYLNGLFERWGIASELKPKITQTPPGVAVGGVVARGDAEIGFQQVSELLPVAGIDYIGPLPPDIQVITVFSGGVHVAARQPDAARELMKFLTSPAAAPMIRRKGMEPAGADL